MVACNIMRHVHSDDSDKVVLMVVRTILAEPCIDRHTLSYTGQTHTRRAREGKKNMEEEGVWKGCIHQ